MAEDQDVRQLLSAIAEQAESEKEAILAEAGTRAREILTQAEAEIEKLKTEAELKGESQVRWQSGRILGQARMKARITTLSVKRTLIEKAFDLAQAEINALCASGNYQTVMENLIREVIIAAGSDAGLKVCAKDLGFCSALIVQLGIEASVQAHGDQPGTLIATSSNGKRRVDNGLFTRFAKAKLTVTPELRRLLFSSEDTS